jgi:hypothetical protein
MILFLLSAAVLITACLYRIRTRVKVPVKTDTLEKRLTELKRSKKNDNH